MSILKRLGDMTGVAGFHWLDEELRQIPKHAAELSEFFDAYVFSVFRNTTPESIDTHSTAQRDHRAGRPDAVADLYTGVEVGFPEGQLLSYCDDPDLCGHLSEAFHQGRSFPKTGSYALDQLCQRLTRHSAYGAFHKGNTPVSNQGDLALALDAIPEEDNGDIEYDQL